MEFLQELHGQLLDRQREGNVDSSYTAKLLASGVLKIAQKVGEEGVEVALAGVAQDDNALLGECADLLYHLNVLLINRDLSWRDVEAVLKQRHVPKS